jgi:RimJ/RimL family protein N-acetyltransferase
MMPEKRSAAAAAAAEAQAAADTAAEARAAADTAAATTARSFPAAATTTTTPTDGGGGGGDRSAGPDTAFSELVSERLILRRFRRSDIAAFTAYRTNPAVARFQGWDVPYSTRQAGRFVREMEAANPDTPGAWFQFAVAKRPDGPLIGDCGAGVRADDARQVEIGFTLAPEHQGSGYATEAVRRLLDYWFVDRGKHRVYASCDARNAASAGVLRRSGFRQEGHLSQSTWAKGEWTDDLIFAVLAGEWARGADGL